MGPAGAMARPWLTNIQIQIRPGNPWPRNRACQDFAFRQRSEFWHGLYVISRPGENLSRQCGGGFLWLREVYPPAASVLAAGSSQEQRPAFLRIHCAPPGA